MPLNIVHHPDYDARFDATHRFPMGKYTAIMRALERKGILGRSILHQPEPAMADLVALAHDPSYVEQVFDLKVPLPVEREIGFPVCAKVARRARLATAGTLLAARIALREGLTVNAAGGSHHARRSQGAGFCTFNDVAVAAARLLDEKIVKRVLVVDLDVHQGDGTADIFRTEPRVFTFSMHGERNYPTRKIPSDLDVGLPDGTGDEAYLARLRMVLPVLSDYARPELVFYNAGVDPHARDRLGKLAMTDVGLALRDTAVISHFRDLGIPVCCVIGGGYSQDVEELAARHAILFERAAGFA